MAGSTFNPELPSPPLPKPPMEKIEVPVQKEAPARKGAEQAGKEKDRKTIKMVDTLSMLGWEPPWRDVTNVLGITDYRR
jgi:septal ring-binding cell division protein DamX